MVVVELDEQKVVTDDSVECGVDEVEVEEEDAERVEEDFDSLPL